MSLTELVAGYFRRNKKLATLRERRMAEDKAKIRDTGSWPLAVLLPLKRQPWQPKDRVFCGDIWIGDLQAGEFVVRDKREQSRVLGKYASLDALVEEWSVD